jgi:3-oxoacyl-(acyl-carrier-protein) synthase
MNLVINAIEVLDANGTSYAECIENYKRGKLPNVLYSKDALPKFEIPITDDELQTELRQLGYDERGMPRVIKLAVLSALRAVKDIEVPKNAAVLGVTLQGNQETSEQVWRAMFAGKKSISPRWGAVVPQSTICTTVSRTLGLRGPSFMINQACSAFITAMSVADLMLETGQTDMVLLVGVDCATNPFTSYIFKSLGVCSVDSVRPFDKERSGTAMGEAAVCYVLTKSQQAQSSLASVDKISVYNDYYNLTSPSPDGAAGKFLLNELGKDMVLDSINCHATATKVGDEIEILSLETLPYSCPIYGLKSSVGHTMASSAGVEMSYSIAGLNQGWIPYTPTTSDPIETKHSVILNNILHKEQTNFAKLSFGFGGASAGIRIKRPNNGNTN